MALKKITVPAAGENQAFDLQGLSVIVISAPAYESALDAPKLSFDDPGDGFPVETGNQWPNDAGRYDRVIITGTSESAGDEVVLLSVDMCLDPERNKNVGDITKAKAGTSFTVDTTDAAQTLSELQLADSEGNLPTSIIVTAQVNPAIYAFNADPDRANDLGHVLIPAVYTAGSEREVSLLEIEGIDFILNWRFAAAIAGSQATLTITPRY